jgi:hypothetical protein
VPAFREWILNDIGNASFTLKAAGLESYIEHGNYVVIENDKLDTWVGVITTPRPWSPRILTVNAKSAMWLFSQRVGSYTQEVNGSWGSVLQQVIAIANSSEPTLLQPGAYFDGISYSSIVDMSNVYTYLQRALAQAQTRLDFRPVVTNGKLKIYVDMQPTLYTPSDLRLEEGLNVKNNSGILIEQGEIYNDVTILGIGLDQIKFTAHAFHTASISKYGLRQILFSEGQSQADVNRLAIVRLAQYAYPRKTLGLTTIDEGDTFTLTRTGASGAVELKSVGYTNGALGFQGSAYIRVVQFDDNTGEANLVCEEIING